LSCGFWNVNLYCCGNKVVVATFWCVHIVFASLTRQGKGDYPIHEESSNNHLKYSILKSNWHALEEIELDTFDIHINLFYQTMIK